MPLAPPRPPRPGWYADPRGGDDFRWWDGEAWTAWLADSEYAPMPRGAVARMVPKPALGSPRPIRGFLIGLAVLAVALLLAVVSLAGRSLPQASRPYLEAVPTPMGTPGRIYQPYQLRPADRTVVIYERLAMQLPVGTTPDLSLKRLPTVLSHATMASGAVTPELAVTVVMGDVERALIVPGDTAASAERIRPALLSRYDPGSPIVVENVRTEPWPRVPGAVRVTFFARYATAVKGSAGDDFTMIVVPWSQGEHAGLGLWVGVVPQAAPAGARARISAAEDTIRLLP